jgi:aminoglycoside phosphotransferase family enzyme
MKERDVEQLAADGAINGKPIRGTVEATHISWVILTPRAAFKIKKPVKLPFLNFSTLSSRRRFCDKEVKLNRRFTAIYRGVVPVKRTKNVWSLGEGPGRTVDYAVEMKRMDTTKKMDVVLENDSIRARSIRALAQEVATFHRRAEKKYQPFHLPTARATFNDIRSIRPFVRKTLGEKWVRAIDRSVAWSDRFLKAHGGRMQQRIEAGFKRDVHGDLHSGNVFLYRKPVLFDGIEFNDAFRQIDVLYEIAFLCMDLERYGHSDLSRLFVVTYSRKFNPFERKEDQVLLVYYKCLRAAIRAKVHALGATQSTHRTRQQHLRETRKYLRLMLSYLP